MLKIQDNLVKNQAIRRHQEKEDRRKLEYPIDRSVGNTVVGSIYDCSRKQFERALTTYWSNLYVGWNPFKNEGKGCWEVWAKPTKKTAILQYHNKITGIKVFTTEYRPNDYEHWVADLPYLTYNFIKKLREMDSWENRYQIQQHDDQHMLEQIKAKEKEEEHIKYVVRHNKQAFKDLLEYTQQGYNPTQFFYKK